MSTALQTAVDQQSRQIAVARDSADESPEWQQILREAEKLASASLTPAHLKVDPRTLMQVPETDRRRVAWQQTIGNCILVGNQAHRWGADIFAVAAETYVVGNKLGYQGKLIAAVVNARGGLKQPLRVIHSTGTGDKFAAVIYACDSETITDEQYNLLEAYADNDDHKAQRLLIRQGVWPVRISVGQAKTQNKMWVTDPEQKLWYSGATKWARRYKPELMLGILSDDDLDRMREERMGVGHEQPQSMVDMVIPASLDASGTIAPPVEIDTEKPAEEPTSTPPDEPPPEPQDPADSTSPTPEARAAAMATIEGSINDATSDEQLDAIDTADPDLTPTDTEVLNKIREERRQALAKKPGKRAGGQQKAFA